MSVRQMHLSAALPVRIIGAGLLLATAAIHLTLWNDGYSDIRWIGPLFILNAVGATVLAIALLVTPARWLWLACAAGALMLLGTLGGLLLSTTTGFLGFYETWQAPWAVTSAVVEAAGVLLLGATALAGARSYVHERTQARG